MNEAINTLQAIVLGLIQGLTEFLPISSSGHLAMIPLVSSWPDQGLAFDCVVHLGTLTAIVYYFRTDLINMTFGFGETIKQRSWSANRDGQMAWMIGFATLPVGFAGLAFKDFVENELRSVEVIAYASIGFGVLLYLADILGKRTRSEAAWGIKDVMIVGLAQAVALIPGTSRSGITMTAALFLGYTREAAARFSFLLSIPVIFLAGSLKIKDWIELPMQTTPLSALVIGYVASAVSAYICVVYFLKFLNRVGMGPFVLYRIILGFVLLWMVW
ncbi:MAG: undecaprenyl-diphosphatase [Zetaproteobacteria bacterium CG2_30_46_52]|nr:MAG: undecaprenyl-diphosphatase [Zetaproteobacteria bacterium CG2_30_46_52]